MAELREVSAILDTGKVELEDLQSAMQAILFHQCLYEDWPHAPSYRLLVRHLAHVQPILAAFGYGLRHHPVAHMLVLEATSQVYGLQMSRLKKDETAVLVVLRLLYAEGISALDENGRVEATTDDIHDRLKTCGEEPPPIARLLDILRSLQRKGLVRVGDHDATEQLTVVTIMPGITILVSDIYVEAVIQWLEARALARLDAEGSLGVPAASPGDGTGTEDAGENGVNRGTSSSPTGTAGPDAKPELPADMLSAVAAYRDGLGSDSALVPPAVSEAGAGNILEEEHFREELDGDEDWIADVAAEKDQAGIDRGTGNASGGDERDEGDVRDEVGVTDGDTVTGNDDVWGEDVSGEDGAADVPA